VSVLLVLLSYLVLTVWWTWPLAALAYSHLPCTGPNCTFDTLYSAWVLAWESRALATAPSQLLDGNIYHPAPDAVLYGPAGLGALPYFAPAFAASGSAAFAMNFTLILCTALAAAAIHLVIVRWTGRHDAGAVAAVTLLTNSWLLVGFVGTAPHLAALHYFPFIVLLAAAPRSSRATLLVLLALIVLQALTDPIYVGPAVFAPLAILAAFRLARRDSRRDGARLALVIVAAGVLLVPVYLAYFGLRQRDPALSGRTLWGVNEADFAIDLEGMFWANFAPTTIAPVSLAIAGVGAVLALFRRGALGSGARPAAVEASATAGWRHAALWTLVGTFLSLPPQAKWNDRGVAIPQTLIAAWTPLYDTLRAPSRLGVAALMGLCLLAGLGYAEVVRALSRSPLRASYWFPGGPWGRKLRWSYPVQRLPAVPASFQAILAGGREPLLKLPALYFGGDAPNPATNALAMYQSTFHWRPLLNGYSSYWPASFLPQMRLAERLPDRRSLARLVRRTDLALVWVDLRGYPQEARKRWANPRALARDFGLELVARDGHQMLFAVTPTP
jgi:hypothetical protein